jgi:hypothetical protein
MSPCSRSGTIRRPRRGQNPAAADLDANARKLEGLSETQPPFLRRLCDGNPSEPNNSQRVTRDLPPDRRRQVIDLDVRFPLL